MIVNPRTIIAAGGLETDSQEISFARYYSRFLRNLTGKDKPVICQLSQSQGEKAETIARDKALYEAYGCEFTALTTFKTKEYFSDTFARADGFFVVGGNAVNMMAIWHARNIVTWLRFAYEQGKPIAGYSAGAMCWFEEFITSDPSIPDDFRKLPGLGWLQGSFAPHYLHTQPGFDWRPPVYEALIAVDELQPGYGCDDGVFAIYENEVLKSFHSVEPKGRAYKIDRQGNTAVREIIMPQIIE